MASLDIVAIKTAITETMQSVASFTPGVYEAQPSQAQASRLVQNRANPSLPERTHWFDIRIEDIHDHEATPLSNRGFRISEIPVSIFVSSRLASEVQEEDRDHVREQIEDDLDLAIKALGTPDNLSETSSSDPTNIIGGVMLSEENRGVPTAQTLIEDWPNRVLRTEIRGHLLVRIT